VYSGGSCSTLYVCASEGVYPDEEVRGAMRKGGKGMGGGGGGGGEVNFFCV